MVYALERFVISDEVMEQLTSGDVIDEQMAEGKTIQQIFGFEDDVALVFYEAAASILEQKRIQDAINGFVFLTTLNPYVPSFWMGLGMSHQLNNEYDAALFSYGMALSIDGTQIYPYIVVAQCCMEMRDFEQADSIIDAADKYAREHQDDEFSAKLIGDAKAAKAYIWEKKMKSKGEV